MDVFLNTIVISVGNVWRYLVDAPNIWQKIMFRHNFILYWLPYITIQNDHTNYETSKCVCLLCSVSLSVFLHRRFVKISFDLMEYFYSPWILWWTIGRQNTLFWSINHHIVISSWTSFNTKLMKNNKLSVRVTIFWVESMYIWLPLWICLVLNMFHSSLYHLTTAIW